MGLKARATLDEDIYHLRDKEITNRRLQEDNKVAWLGSSYVYTDSFDAEFGVRFVFQHDVSTYSLYYSHGYAIDGHCGVRPAVSAVLNSKIFVDREESEKLGIWQLIPKK